MNLDELKGMTYSEIEHSGVKGMKWGKRKGVSSNTTTTTKVKEKKEPGKLRKNISSNKREVMLLKDLRDPSRFSDSELKTKTTRVRQENDLKRLTDTKGITSRTKKAYKKREIYWDRDKLSDAELKTKVDRLQLEDNLKNQIKKSNGNNIKAANSIINQTSSLVLKQFSDDKGNFSATGDPMYDTIIKAALGQTAKKKMIQQSAVDNTLYGMTLSELEHAGVKGMKWGKRKAPEKSTKNNGSISSNKSNTGSNSDEEYTKALSNLTSKKFTPKQREENLKNNKEKSLRKLGDGEKKLYPPRLKRHY